MFNSSAAFKHEVIKKKKKETKQNTKENKQTLTCTE